MLRDKSFRRTVHCRKYSQLVKEKDLSPLIIPFDIPVVDGRDFSEETINKDGMDTPVLIKSSHHSRKSLGLKLPSADTTLSDIADTLGRDFPVKIIEVGSQHEIEGFTIGEYADYLEHRSGMHKLLNMISLEVSATPLSTSVLSPRVVRQIDWIDCFWPEDRRAISDFPRVQKYVLAGMAGSYTDFHVDFGGTSVWYHVIRGCKVFYLIPPTTINLRAYAKWIRSSDQESIFFPESLQMGECKKVTIGAGDTLMIPSGWIHAVYTPEDSLVIGGNFLLSPAIVPQLQVYRVEHQTRVSQKYRFPFFRQLAWCVLCQVLIQELGRRHCQSTTCNDIKEEGGSDDDDEDEDDSEDDDSGSPLVHPRVAWGWPYLVKAVTVWVHEGLSSEDMREMQGAAERCLQRTSRRGLSLPPPPVSSIASGAIGTILDAWWTLLETLPESITTTTLISPRVSGGDESPSSTSTDRVSRDLFLHFSDHLQKIWTCGNSSEAYDVLDDDLFEYFPFVNKAPSFYSAGSGTDGSLSDFQADKEAPKNDVFGSVVEAAGLLDRGKEPLASSRAVKQEESAVPLSPLKLSLKLNRPDPSLLAPPTHSAHSRVLKLELSPPTVESTATSTAATISTEAAAHLGHGQQWGHTSHTTVTNTKSRAAKNFGTRGKRLSAGFLQQAADFDVGWDEEEDDHSDGGRDSGSEEEDIDSEHDEVGSKKRGRGTVIAESSYRAAAVSSACSTTAHRAAKKPRPATKKTQPRGAASLLKARLKKKW